METTKKLRSFEKKQAYKHSIHAVDLINTVLESEKDQANIVILTQLKKEVKKLWRIYTA